MGGTTLGVVVRAHAPIRPPERRPAKITTAAFPSLVMEYPLSYKFLLVGLSLATLTFGKSVAKNFSC